MEGESKADNIDSIILEEEIDPNYVPSEAEVVEYSKWLGMDLEKDQDLFWIAREGLKAPLPENWKPCKTKDTDDIYYFNFTTGESTWDHPCDGFYKRLYEEEKKKKEISIKENNDAKRSQAKQDVQQLLGKSEKKKKKVAALEPSGAKVEIDLAPVLDRKPLPGIKPLGPLSSSFSGKILGLEAKPVDDNSSSRSQTPLSNTGHNLSVARGDDSAPSSNILNMKSSSKLGMIGSLRAANESAGNLASLTTNSSNQFATNIFTNNNNTESKPLERQKYRDEMKPIIAEERITFPNSSSDFATADAKEFAREVPTDKPLVSPQLFVAPSTINKNNTVVSDNNNNNAIIEQLKQEERQLRAEIDRLTAENTRLTKKVDYLEQDVQSASRKSDQNTVYYNDRINTLDNDLLDAKKQVLSKDEEIFSLKNSVRNLETDFSHRQQLHNETFAVEQRKTQSLETQLLEIQRLCFSKDDEIARLKLNLDIQTNSNNNERQQQQIISDLRSQLSALEDKCAAQSTELREALSKPLPPSVSMVYNNASLSKLKEENQRFESELSDLSQANNRQQQQLSTVQQALQEKEAECDRLTRLQQSQQLLFNEMMLKLEDAEKSKLFLTQNISGKEQELAVLRRKTDLIQEQQQQLQQQLQQQTQTIANLSNSNANSSNNSGNNNDREKDLFLSRLQQQLQQQQERDLQLVAQHEQDMASMRNKQEVLKHEISLLQMNLSTAQMTIRLQTEENVALRVSVTRLQDTVAQLEGDQQEKARSQMQLQSQCDGYKLEIQRLQSTASQLAHTQEILRLKEDELSSVKTQLLETQRQHQQQVSSATAQVGAGEVNLWRTKYETKTAEMRSKTEEISFLQGQLETAYNDLSAAQNNMRSLQAEAKTMQQEIEHLQHLLQSETDASTAKDKKIRGFREELLHLQKLLSDMEQSKRNSNDNSNNVTTIASSCIATCDTTSQTTTQPYPEYPDIATTAVAKKDVRDTGVQKNAVSVRDIGVSAVTIAQHIACQTSPVPILDSNNNKNTTSCSINVQTDPVTPEIREVIRTVHVPMSDQNNNNKNSNEEMRLQMQYMREVREELGEKMQQCNQLLAAITSNSCNNNTNINKNENTTKSKVQIVRDTQDTPVRSELLDSVSEVFSPPPLEPPRTSASHKLLAFLERLTAAVSELLQGSLQYVARTHTSSGTHSLLLVATQSLVTDVVRPSVTIFKSLVKEGRQAVQDMKLSYQEMSQRVLPQPRTLFKAKETINILTNDLNLCIRLTRLLQDTDATLRHTCYTLQQLQQQKGPRNRGRDNDKEVLQELVRRTDAEVRLLRDTSLFILQQLSLNNSNNNINSNKHDTNSCSHENSSSSLDEPFHSPYDSSDMESVSDFFSDRQLFFNSNNYNNCNNVRKTMQGHRSVSPPQHNRPFASRHDGSHKIRSHSSRTNSLHRERDTARHTTRSVSPTSYRHYSEHLLDSTVVPSTAMSAAVSRHTSYRDKLDIIQRQLSSAQQKQADSLREYNRHYNWLGSLVREIGQQATAPVAFRSSLDSISAPLSSSTFTSSAVRTTKRVSTPLATINPNILYNTGVSSAKPNKLAENINIHNVKPPQFYL